MKEEESKEKTEKKELKMNFFNKVKYSIFKIEKYPDMAAEGVGKAISYMSILVAILAVILCIGMLYQTHDLLQDGIHYIQNEFPEFSYKEGILKVESENVITISEDDSVMGKTIIDTKTEDEQIINQYINSVTESGEGIIILKDKAIIKSSGVAGTVSYSYKDALEQLGINEFKKQDVVNYVNSSQIVTLYVSVFLTVFVYAFIMYLLTTISNAVLLSFFGYITTLLARIKIRYAAIFNMSVYALTLSIILNMLYVAINIFITFNMEYFQVMYVAVAAIYLVAAILILKTEFIKQQFELTKIAEAQEIVKKEIEEQEQKDKEEKEREERKEKDKEAEKEKDKDEKSKSDSKQDDKKNKKRKEKNDQKKDTGEEVEGSAEA